MPTMHVRPISMFDVKCMREIWSVENCDLLVILMVAVP